MIDYRSAVGIASAFVSAALIARWKKNRPDEVELVVTDDDALRMLHHDSIGVYETKYGPIFTAMSKEAMRGNDEA